MTRPSIAGWRWRSRRAALRAAGAEVDRRGDRRIPRDAGRRQPGRAVRGQGRRPLEAAARPARTRRCERCDLGKGPGVVKGAFVELPRYFADTGRVQDLESRLLTCMETLQGFDAAEIAKTPFGRGEQANVEALVAWISAESRGLKFNLPQAHAAGAHDVRSWASALFFFRGGPYDFACASCHGEDGKRIRLQDLPDLTKNPGDGVGFARLAGLPRLQRRAVEHAAAPERLLPPAALSRIPATPRDVTIALGVYMGVNAKGAESIAPALKR